MRSKSYSLRGTNVGVSKLQQAPHFSQSAGTIIGRSRHLHAASIGLSSLGSSCSFQFFFLRTASWVNVETTDRNAFAMPTQRVCMWAAESGLVTAPALSHVAFCYMRCSVPKLLLDYGRARWTDREARSTAELQAMSPARATTSGKPRGLLPKTITSEGAQVAPAPNANRSWPDVACRSWG